MHKIALLFPGQGVQRVGMGTDVASHYSAAARVFEQADEIMGMKLSELCFAGPQEKLNITEYAQPALLTTCMAIAEALKEEGLEPIIMAGLSLGEYTALTAAGALTFEQALPLVAERGRLMQSSSAEGSMMAINGLEAAQVEKICQDAGGEVWVANYNCPGQVVISGEKTAVARAGQQARESGARILPLKVSVASHCPLMREAADQLLPWLERVDWQKPSVSVVSNVTADIYGVDDMIPNLYGQLFMPVYWEQSIRRILEQADFLIEAGPGTSLASLVKRIQPDRFLGSVQDTASLQQLLERMK